MQEQTQDSSSPLKPVSLSGASPERSAMLTLLALAISSQDNAREIGDLLPPEAIDCDTVPGRVLNLLLGAAAGGEPESETALALNDLLAENKDEEVGGILVRPPEFSDPAKALADSVSELIRISKKRRYAAIMAELRFCPQERREELMKQLLEVQKTK